ncbi:MAG: methylenetetrahydrofolate--tRNA-(uracil(54)-C(5))-methyltransferase (FADH(2)-oxidizing) TrmFO, partial [Ruminococcaceae bacterium]|nr:methylenetetrahydrofolate--tRNA-(uracil(54)-C(5))-methyltransferase (FADH(2)-oxidizing) TrmFO [Oscillospiraceae bacterium]
GGGTLITAERAPTHDIDKPNVYEGCMPIEIMAKRGADTIRFGPMKPVGLRDPATGHRPWANLQLRREDAEGTRYNLVGFQTNLKFGEQKRVFGMIPALANAEFVRYGVMHRNTFIDSPRVLSADFSMKQHPDIFFAGQITGVEGYMESAGAGILAGINAARRILGEQPLVLPRTTMLGALTAHVSDELFSAEFQPMGANFGIIPPLENHIRDKQERYAALSERALEALDEVISGA